MLLYQCSPFHAGSPFWPVIRQLAFAARFEPGDDPAGRRAKLASIVTAPERLDLLASLLGVATGPDPLSGLDPDERRHRTLRALVDELAHLAGRGPVLVLMEDVHWVDPSTLELVERTLEAIASRPVLLVLTARPEGEPRLGPFPHLARLVLARLDRAAVEAIVGRLVEARALDAAVRAQILARGDGVPLFVEELTKAVLDQAPAGQGVTVPATLQDSLLARLDRDPVAKRVAQIAACIGREFEHDLLAAVCDLAPADLQRGIEALLAAELVWRRGRGTEASYAFKHALLRDAAYESLLKSRRREIHGRIADALEARPDTAPEVAAHHREAADRPAEAARAWARAGEQALGRAAMIEAEAALERARALLAQAPAGEGRDRAELVLLERLAVALVGTRGPGSVEVERVHRRAARLAHELGDRQARFRALWTLWRTHNVRAEFEAALAIGEQLRAEAEREETPDLLYQAEHALWSTRMFRGELRQVLAHAERGLALYDFGRHAADALTYGGDDAKVCGLIFGGTALFLLGFPEQALARNRAALEQAERHGHPQVLGHALNWGLLLLHLAGELDELAQRVAWAQQLAERHGLATHRPEARILAAWLRVARERDAGAAAVIQEQLRSRLAMGTAFAQTYLLSLSGDALLRLGRPAEALAALGEGLARAERTGEGVCRAELLRLRAAARLALDRADRGPAEAELAAALAAARAQGARLWELRAARDLARLWAEAGERQRARDLLAPIHAWFTEGRGTPDLVEAGALLDALA